jgi:hypothetical protein
MIVAMFVFRLVNSCCSPYEKLIEGRTIYCSFKNCFLNLKFEKSSKKDKELSHLLEEDIHDEDISKLVEIKPKITIFNYFTPKDGSAICFNNKVNLKFLRLFVLFIATQLNALTCGLMYSGGGFLVNLTCQLLFNVEQR